MTTTYSDGMKILRKIAEEDKNWRGGMAQIQELLLARIMREG